MISVIQLSLNLVWFHNITNRWTQIIIFLPPQEINLKQEREKDKKPVNENKKMMQSSLVKIQHPLKPCLTLNLRNLELFYDEEQGNEKNKTPIDIADSKERFCSALKRPCVKVGTP